MSWNFFLYYSEITYTNSMKTLFFKMKNRGPEEKRFLQKVPNGYRVYAGLLLAGLCTEWGSK